MGGLPSSNPERDANTKHESKLKHLTPNKARHWTMSTEPLPQPCTTRRSCHFRPCIDLHGGFVKQIVGSSLKDGTDAAAPITNFSSTDTSDAAKFAKMYQNDGLSGGHIIMLGPGNEAAAMASLTAFPGGMQVGGGINPSNARTYLDAGASHVIVTSWVFRQGQVDFERLKEMVSVVGKDKLVLDLSCRSKPGDGESGRYYVVTDRWQKFTDVEITKENLDVLAAYCAEFLVHGVDVEGLRVGIIEDLVEKLGRWSPIPVTYAGGARSLEDLEKVNEIGQGKVDLTIGSALDIFGGKLAYKDVVEWHKRNVEETRAE